jgi:uncharacterized membrane protein
MVRIRYERVSGRSVERLAALSDGVFAVAMTLLVLDLHVPVRDAIHSEADLCQALTPLAPRLLIYVMSFLMLGIIWVGQQTQMNHVANSDRHYTWIHLVFLLAVSLMPFSTSLMAEFIEYRLALLTYWLNVAALGLMLFIGWRYAIKTGLVRDEVDAETARGIGRRIVMAQSLYALGALLCVISTYWSIGFIVLVQLNYAIGPSWWGRSRA